jgi:hypothetical protein
MVDGFGCQEKSGTEAADASFNAYGREEGIKKVWTPSLLYGRSYGRWCGRSAGHHGRIDLSCVVSCDGERLYSTYMQKVSVGAQI